MLHVLVDKDKIAGPLQKVQSIVDKKTIMNIINNVFIYTDDKNLFVEATDLEISYRSKIPCQIKEQGAVTVNSRQLFEIVKDFPSPVIEFTEDENCWVTIGAGEKAEYKIGGLPPDDFPKFRHINSDNYGDIASSTLKELIDKTIFSASFDEKKFALSGIFMQQIMPDSDENDTDVPKLRMVSSDGHRLSLMEAEIPSEHLDLKSGVILPKKGAQEIKKIIEDNESARLGIDDNFCFVTSGSDQLVIRLIDGTFPDYRVIIPATRERFLTFNRDIVYNALKRISVLCSDSMFRGVKACITSNAMEIESLDKNLGEAREIVEISYDGEPFDMAFNAKYMMEALSVMDSDEVILTANNADSPCLLTGEKDKGFLGLIMPMSLDRE
jgi:DNA polymerase-3 subunit beta